VRYIGTSTFAAYQLVESLWASEKGRVARFVSEQPPYNLLDRRIERELLPVCRTYGFGVIPWSPLAGGMLTGKYRRNEQAPAGSRYESGTFRSGEEVPEAAWNVIEGVRTLAEEKGVAMDAFALAWVLHQEGVTSPSSGRNRWINSKPISRRSKSRSLKKTASAWTNSSSRERTWPNIIRPTSARAL
jgi:aryl-alcohol dehydrogenase-like predicted oxidoreductase